MLAVEADILNLNEDCVRLLQGYREQCLDARAVRAKAAADEEEEERASEQQAKSNQEAGDAPQDAAESEALPSPELTEEVAPAPKVIDKSDPWVARINELDGVEIDELSSMHGRLIAAGLINFQIKNRQTGVEYRVANAGKQYLTRQLSGDPEDDE